MIQLQQQLLVKNLATVGAIVVGAGILGLATKDSGGGVQGFAKGGIVTKPTMGIIGEAGQSEAVIPLNRLPQMMGAIGGNQKGEFTLRGQDLILALERAGDFRARIIWINDMSYGLQYFTNFFDTDENKFRLEILQWQFTGTAQSNITLADNAVTINYNQDDDYFQPIIGSTCKMRFYVEVGTGGDNWENENTLWNEADFAWDKEYTFILPDNDREYKIRVLSLNASGESDTWCFAQTVLKDTTASFTSTVKSGDLVVNTSTGNYANLDVVDSDTELTLSSGIFSTSSAQNYEIYRPYWVGFIMQDSYTLPIASRPYAVEVVASDLIGTINGYNMDITTERPETFDVIQNCLKNINLQSGDGTTGRGLDFGYKVLCRLNQYSSSTPSGSSNDNPYTQTYLNSVDSLQDENGNYLNCKYVLESLLRMFNCRIFQHESTWTIIDNASLALTSFSDGGGSYSKEFKFYFKDGQPDGTVAIASPVLNIDSTENNSTIQPLNQDLIKIIRRPAIRQRVQVRIKDTLKSRFSNGGYETVTSASGGTPSWGKNLQTGQYRIDQ